MGYVTIAFDRKVRQRPGYQAKSGATETGNVMVDARGNVTCTINTVPEGQGHETTVAQLVANELTIPMDNVRVVADFDSNSRAWSIATGTYSSRFAAAGASAALLSARQIKAKMGAIAASTLEAAADDIILADGVFSVKGAPERAVPFRRVAGIAHWNPNSLPAGMEAGLQNTSVWNFAAAVAPDELDRVNSSQLYGFVAEIVAVEVDRETGQVEIKHYYTMHDAGRILNPLIVEGQIYGAVLHGVAGAMFEEMTYGEDGAFLAGTFMDYLCPTAMEAPELTIGHVENPTPMSLTGAKGVGESSSETAPAVDRGCGGRRLAAPRRRDPGAAADAQQNLVPDPCRRGGERERGPAVKPAVFEYFAPTTVAEAVALLGEHADEAKILAGGQSLVPLMNMRLAKPGVLIDVNPLRELDYVRVDDGHLAVGAVTRQRTLERSPLVAEQVPLIRETLQLPRPRPDPQPRHRRRQRGARRSGLRAAGHAGGPGRGAASGDGRE